MSHFLGVRDHSGSEERSWWKLHNCTICVLLHTQNFMRVSWFGLQLDLGILLIY